MFAFVMYWQICFSSECSTLHFESTPVNLQCDLPGSCSFAMRDYRGHQLLQHGDMRLSQLLQQASALSGI